MQENNSSVSQETKRLVDEADDCVIKHIASRIIGQALWDYMVLEYAGVYEGRELTSSRGVIGYRNRKDALEVRKFVRNHMETYIDVAHLDLNANYLRRKAKEFISIIKPTGVKKWKKT